MDPKTNANDGPGLFRWFIRNLPFGFLNRRFLVTALIASTIAGLIDPLAKPDEADFGLPVILFCFLGLLAFFGPFFYEPAARLILRSGYELGDVRSELSWLALICVVMGGVGVYGLVKTGCAIQAWC